MVSNRRRNRTGQLPSVDLESAPHSPLLRDRVLGGGSKNHAPTRRSRLAKSAPRFSQDMPTAGKRRPSLTDARDIYPLYLESARLPSLCCETVYAECALLYEYLCLCYLSSLDTDDRSGSVVPSGRDRQLPAHSPALLVARRDWYVSCTSSHAHAHTNTPQPSRTQTDAKRADHQQIKPS